MLEALRRTTPKLPAEIRDQFAGLFSPQNIGITSFLLTAWGGSHLVGVGEIADVTFLVAGFLMMGQTAVDVASEFKNFITIASNAQDVDGLDEASSHAAKVVSVVGVTILTIFLLKSAARTGISPTALETPPVLVEAPPVTQGAPGTLNRLFPLDQELPGDGAIAQAMRRAVAQEVYQEIPSFAGNRARDASGNVLHGTDGKTINNRHVRASHIDGINLSKGMVRRAFKPGMEIIQYEGPRGPGLYATYEGVDPRKLGIIVKGRVMKRYVVAQSFEALESTASTLEQGRAAGVGGSGGGKQLLLPHDWLSKVKLDWQSSPPN